MKCPKCGYNTFEYLDSCKKCGKELGTFKESMGIRPLVLQAVAPAAIATGGGGEGGEPISQQADDKLFQWDVPESAAGTELADIEDFGLVLGEEEVVPEEPPKDPFSFDDEFDIPLAPKQSEPKPEAEDPFGGFSLDDLGGASEEASPGPVLEQETELEKPSFDGFAFEDEEILQTAQTAIETLPPMAAPDTEDIFGGISFDAAAEMPAGGAPKELLPDAEADAEDIFGEFSFDDEKHTPVVEATVQETDEKAIDDIFGDVAFEDSSAIPPSSEPADLGLDDIFGEKGAPAVDSGQGGEFSLDAFADDFPGASVDAPPAGAIVGDEFDLDDFLKIEDDPKGVGSQGGGAKTSDEDLDALFGELDLMEKK